MKDPGVDPGFSWPLALFVTGVCFVTFFCILEKLNENDPRLFLWIGLATLAIALVTALVSLVLKQRQSS